ncbi:hypothetical protein DV735_g5696, partial [Chaetothyriales sp. CBS 134920]
MADPFSIAASVLAISTAALQSAKSLSETVKRFKDRSKTLARLQNELVDLTTILDSLAQVSDDAEPAMLRLLEGPVKRCSQVCRDFEKSMESFGAKSKPGFRDWTKMEFMRGDMNTFIDTISGYKLTISVGLGTITMLIPEQVLEEFNEMVQDTAYNLELHLQQIDEKMTQLNLEKFSASGASTDLEDEKAVTKQCLRVCEDARSYIESLSARESHLLRTTGVEDVRGEEQNIFEAQLRTRQALEGNQSSFAETIEHLRKRLNLLMIQKDSPEKDRERAQLQADLDISKQCLDVCKVASEISRQKVYRIGEVIAEADSDQVVVTTLADLFDIKKATSKGKSAQLVGSMTPANLDLLTEKRYSSRFGALALHYKTNNNNSAGTATATATTPNLPTAFEDQNSKSTAATQTGLNREQSPGPPRTRPAPNEIRKRQLGGGTEQE